MCERNHNQSLEIFCQEPSDRYIAMLDELCDDPRSVEGVYAIKKAGPMAKNGWVPSFDSRDFWGKRR